MRKQLGKIESVDFGFGGYDDAMIGLSIQLGDGSWGCGDFKGTWGMDPSEHAEWTIDSQTKKWGETVRYLRDLLAAAKVKTVEELKGIPIEATFDDTNRLKDWRVLTEVL